MKKEKDIIEIKGHSSSIKFYTDSKNNLRIELPEYKIMYILDEDEASQFSKDLAILTSIKTTDLFSKNKDIF